MNNAISPVIQIGPELQPETWHERHRALFDYWRSIAPEGRLPARAHFDPAAVPKLLPYLSLYDIEHTPRLRLRFRLAGTALRQWTGLELTGRYTDEISDVSALMERLAPAIAAGEGLWRRWPRLVQVSDSYSFMEALLLPLADDGRHVDMLLGLYLAYDVNGQPLDM